VAAAEGRPGRIHRAGISAKQRLHLAALLISLAALPLFGQSDIDFDPGITQEQFATFSRLVAQGIYATPVDPARARGLLGFDIGVSATAVPIDVDAPYWQNSVSDDFTYSDHLVVPRVVASKGLSVATISAMYSEIPDTDIAIWGAALDVPIIDGGVLKPTLAVRGAYATLQGIDELDLKTYGAELFLSKGFGPITPYGAVGVVRTDARGNSGTATAVPIILEDESTTNRITLGLKLSLFIPKIVVEATQGEERSYAAKVSFGL
jgi:hypothetical protein